MKKPKSNFIVDANCDGELKRFTVSYVCEAHLRRIATKTAVSMFGASSVIIIEYIKIWR